MCLCVCYAAGAGFTFPMYNVLSVFCTVTLIFFINYLTRNVNGEPRFPHATRLLASCARFLVTATLLLTHRPLHRPLPSTVFAAVLGWDVFVTHGLGGLFGSALVGLFAQNDAFPGDANQVRCQMPQTSGV